MLHVIRLHLNYNNNAYFRIKCMFSMPDIRLEVDVEFKYEHEHEKFNSNQFKMFELSGVFFSGVLSLLNIRYSICGPIVLVHCAWNTIESNFELFGSVFIDDIAKRRERKE